MFVKNKSILPIKGYRCMSYENKVKSSLEIKPIKVQKLIKNQSNDKLLDINSKIELKK